MKKYRYGFLKFKKWCDSFNPIIPFLPASDLHVALYITHLALKASTSVIDEAVCSIAWAHNIAGLQNPCASSLVSTTREGAKRITSKPVSKKEPITSDILVSLVTKYGNSDCNLLDLRIVSMCLIGYAGFLRFSEIVNIKRSDIQFFDSHLSLFVSKSKTDVYKDGSSVYISRTFLPTCPVAALERYLSLAKIKNSSDEFIFRNISFMKKDNSYKLRSLNRPLCYTRAREILLSALESLGLNKKLFGLHSLRSGGATAAADAGINDRVFKKHGRWKSETAKDGYVRENLIQKLSVSKHLGI